MANEQIKKTIEEEYKYGFETNIEQDTFLPGLNHDIVRKISNIKEEPEWLLNWRLHAFDQWLKMSEPEWANVKMESIDYQAISYYSSPRKKTAESLDDVDPEILETYTKLGIPLNEQKMLEGVAVDAVFDSVSVATTFKDSLKKAGVIFCSFSEAVKEYPDLIKKYLGSVVPITDNFYAALNSAVFSDGSFVYIPKGVKCPMELSTYFRINAANTKYSTVQNWYPGDKNGKGGIYNFVTKRGACRGHRSKISWTQVETGSSITWKYPSCILQGDDSIGEFYSVALTNNYQQADTGTKMIHLGKNTKSTIISKGISAGKGQQTYRGEVKIMKSAANARNFSQCDSILIGDKCGAHTFPYIDVRNPTAQMEHEATTSNIGEDQLFYCNQRGIATEDAVSLIVNGFCKEVFKELPMEFAVEAQKLMEVSLEGSVG